MTPSALHTAALGFQSSQYKDTDSISPQKDTVKDDLTGAATATKTAPSWAQANASKLPLGFDKSVPLRHLPSDTENIAEHADQGNDTEINEGVITHESRTLPLDGSNPDTPDRVALTKEAMAVLYTALGAGTFNALIRAIGYAVTISVKSDKAILGVLAPPPIFL